MRKSLLFLAFSISTLFVLGQAPPNAFNYSAVARDGAGTLVTNQAIALQMSILQSTAVGSLVYQETHNVSTDDYGLFNLIIGAGAVQQGTFSSINWAGDSYYLKIEMDITGSTNYTNMGTTQFLSVPYAFHSNTADSLVGGINSLESDSVFTASLASSITASDTAYWNSIIDTDTQLDSGNIISLGYVAGRTIDNDTQLDSIDIANLGFTAGGHTIIDTDTQLDSIDIANLGFTTGIHSMIDTDTQLDSNDIANFNYVAEKTYSLGLYPEIGGYVFRISANGKHGLVCETQVQSYSASWYGSDTLIKNLAYHSLDGQRFSDWRLPTRFELNEIYLNRADIGNLGTYCYWSSSEYDFGKAWKQNFGLNPTPGAQGLNGKSRVSCGIISVRSF